MLDRNRLIRDNFIAKVTAQEFPKTDCTLSLADVDLSSTELIDIFESQVMSRTLDLQSRIMQKQGKSFYTIGSSGHEGSAAYAKAFLPTDMAFLHYRSGAFCIQRGKQVDGETTLYDMMLSFAASREDPISGGRHKVLGSKKLNIPPQTSTIASHLPKAVGMAYSIGLSKRIKHQGNVPNTSIVLCNFGDASSNHSTAQGAINSAAWAAFQSIPMPIVFICEDNGIGISTATPNGWIKSNFSHRAGLTYLYCDGLNVLDTYKTAQRAEYIARTLRKPVFLHIKMVRLLGHAGSDAEFVYRDVKTIEQNEAQDPLLHSARILIDNQVLTADQIVKIYQDIEQRVALIGEQAAKQPRLASASEVKQSIIPPAKDVRDYQTFYRNITPSQREQLFSHEKHNLAKKQHSAKLINWALLDLMAEQKNIVLCGEDIGKKGGVYNVTTKLCERFGQNRVVNTLLDEQSILGMAIGLAHNNFLPIPEIQFLAYVHNAEDQIRGEAATLSFFSKGQFANGMVIRIAGLAYQRGFGGHFHNDNSFAVFRDLPGVIIACPSNGADAVSLLRTCVQLAQQQQRDVIFIEPIALYMTHDLLEKGDEKWAHYYETPDKFIPVEVGRVSSHGSGKDLCIISYGNGYYLSRQAQALLENKNIHCKVVDLRWLAPLDKHEITSAISGFNKILIVDECRQTASISEALNTMIVENCQDQSIPIPTISRITAEDCFIPLGSAATTVLPSCDEIVQVASEMVANEKGHSLYQRESK